MHCTTPKAKPTPKLSSFATTGLNGLTVWCRSSGNFEIHVDMSILGPVDLLPGSEQPVCFFFFLLESPRQLQMWVHAATSLQKKERKTSLFLAFTICSHVILPPVARLHCEKSSLRFCPFPNEIVLNPLPPILNRLCLETNYELMIWSLNWWKVASVTTHPLAPVMMNAHCAIQLHWVLGKHEHAALSYQQR